VGNYAEREHFEREHADSGVIDMYWRQGAGVNLVVCGYTTKLSVLLEFRHVAHLQVYMKTSADSFLSHRIGFSNNTRNSSKLQRPFLEQLSLFDRCRFGTLEILWKYYRSITTSNQRRHRSNQLQLGAAAASSMCASTRRMSTDTVDDTNSDDPEHFLPAIRLELSAENVDTFVSVVSEAYKTSFE
jgi:hypothetical protein